MQAPCSRRPPRRVGRRLQPFSPLGQAMLTGAITSQDQVTGGSDDRSTLPRFQGEHFASNLTLVESLTAVADSLGVTAAQLSLAWVLSQGDSIAPIPGTRRRRWLEQNVGAADLELAPDTLSALDTLFVPGTSRVDATG